MTRSILLASRNPKKLAEMRRILAPLLGPVALPGLDEWPQVAEVAETGATFADNALLKARAGHQATGLAAIAEDSGLSVDALGGMPGVLSARWSGRHGDDSANLQLVLDQLRDVPDERRGAAFVCVAAYVDGSVEASADGRMPGRLVRAARGGNGFGYDPIFVANGYDVTNAELDAQHKDAISHRGAALRALAGRLASTLHPEEGTPR